MNGGSRLFLAKLTGVATVLLASVGVSACGSSTRNLDSVTVERAIAKSILTERGLYTTVACPSKVPQLARRVFTCTARLDVGRYPVMVTEINGSGRVGFRDERPLVVIERGQSPAGDRGVGVPPETSARDRLLSSRGAAASGTRLPVHGRDRRRGASLPVRGQRARRCRSRAIRRHMRPNVRDCQELRGPRPS